MTIRELIWYNFVRNKFNLEYLAIFTRRINSRYKFVENMYIFLSIFSAAGILKFNEHSKLFAIILLCLNIFKIVKSRFTLSDTEILIYNSEFRFYQDQSKNWELLWIKFVNKIIDEENAFKVAEKYIDDESIMIKINKHDKLEDNNEIQNRASIETNNYLNKFYNG